MRQFYIFFIRKIYEVNQEKKDNATKESKEKNVVDKEDTSEYDSDSASMDEHPKKIQYMKIAIL